MRLLSIIWLVGIAVCLSAQTLSKDLNLIAGQRVYVVGVESSFRDLSLSKLNLTIERLAKDQFAREGVFKNASAPRYADFVFLVILDPSSKDREEIAIAVSAADYTKRRADLDALRDVALWQSSASTAVRHTKPATKKQAVREIIASRYGFGLSVVQDLVMQFHREILAH